LLSRTVAVAVAAALLNALPAAATPEAPGSDAHGFGGDGRVAPRMPLPVAGVADLVARSPQGLLAAMTMQGSTAQFAAVRLGHDGRRKKSFGKDGVSRVPMPRATVSQVAWSGRKVVLVGQGFGKLGSPLRSSQQLGLVRLTRTGARDKTFGDGGVVADLPVRTAAPSDGDRIELYAMDVKALDSGALLVAVWMQTRFGGEQVALVRLTDRGRLDTSYGEGGTRIVDDGVEGRVYWRDLDLTPDGGLVMAGVTPVDGTETALLRVARIGADAQPDPTFAENGVRSLTVPMSSFGQVSLARHPDGHVSALFSDRPHGEDAFSYLTRLTAGGEVAPPFAESGQRRLPLVPTAVRSVGIHGLKMLARADGVGGIHVYRTLGSGDADTRFSGDGVRGLPGDRYVSYHGLALSHGRVYALGSRWRDDLTRLLFVALHS